MQHDMTTILRLLMITSYAYYDQFNQKERTRVDIQEPRLNQYTETYVWLIYRHVKGWLREKKMREESKDQQNVRAGTFL